MCLETAHKYVGPATVVGFKVVMIWRGHVCSPHQDNYYWKQGINKVSFPVQLQADDDILYESGFHCFLHREDAEIYMETYLSWRLFVHKVIEVTCSDIKYSGRDYFPAIVCDTVEISEKEWNGLLHS